jgi:hypothetical protein
MNAVADRLLAWRRATHEVVSEQELAFNREFRGLIGYNHHGLPRIGGGAPQLPVTLAVLIDAAANTTWTTAQSIIGQSATPGPAFTGPVGPFSIDYFRAESACWQQEAMGVISTTVTPTIAFGTYFGVVTTTITTVLNITPTITTASGLANVNWYWKALGRTVVNSGATSTTLCTGMLFGNIEVLAASVAGEPIQYAVNATPPTAVTTDFSSAVCLDLKATWGTSSASNAITCNYYELTSRYS